MRKHFVTRICGTPYVCMNIILICAEVLLTCLNLLTTTAHWDRECLTVLFLNWGGSPLPHVESNKTAQEEKTMLERCASLLSSLSDVEPSDVAPVVATSPSLSSVRLSVAAVGGPESMAIESAGPVSVPIHPSPAGRTRCVGPAVLLKWGFPWDTPAVEQARPSCMYVVLSRCRLA